MSRYPQAGNSDPSAWQVASSLAKLLNVNYRTVELRGENCRSGVERREATAAEREDYRACNGRPPKYLYRSVAAPIESPAEVTGKTAWKPFVPARKRLTITEYDAPPVQTEAEELREAIARESALIEHIDDLTGLVDRLRSELGARKPIKIKMGPFVIEVER